MALVAVFVYSATMAVDPTPPPSGATLFAIDLVYGEPRVRLRVASVLANDILRIGTGLADAAAKALLDGLSPAKELAIKIEGLRNRIDMLEAVAAIAEKMREAEASTLGGKTKQTPIDSN